MATNQPKTRLTVETTTVLRIIAVILGSIATVYALWAIKHAIGLLLFSFFLALALNPPVSFFASKMPKGSRLLGTGLAYAIVVAALGLFIYAAVPQFMSDSRDLIDKFPGYVDELREGDGFVANTIKDLNIDQEARELADNFTNSLGSTDGGVISGLGRVSSSLVSGLTVLVLTFLMLVEGPAWLELFWSVYPERRRKHHKKIAGKMYQVVTGYVNGQLLVALIAAMSSMIAMILAGIEPQTAVPLAGLVGFMGLIPLVGTTLGAVVVILVAAFTSLGSAFLMLGFFIIYQQIENNVIQPYIQSKTVDMSPLLVFVAVIIGLTAGGVIGAFVAIPVAGMARVLIVEYYKIHANKTEKSTSSSDLKKLLADS